MRRLARYNLSPEAKVRIVVAAYEPRNADARTVKEREFPCVPVLPDQSCSSVEDRIAFGKMNALRMMKDEVVDVIHMHLAAE